MLGRMLTDALDVKMTTPAQVTQPEKQFKVVDISLPPVTMEQDGKNKEKGGHSCSSVVVDSGLVVSTHVYLLR